MAYDVERLRELMFALEDRQQSPRVTIVLSLEEEAIDLDCTIEQVAEILDTLLALDYIDGAGHDEHADFWLFRRLTRKGTQFVQATRAPRDWERMKRRFEAQRTVPR